VKTITVNIEDDAFLDLVKAMNFRQEFEGCVADPSMAEQLWYDLLTAMEAGKVEVTMGRKKAVS